MPSQTQEPVLRPTLLAEADLETVVIAPTSPAAAVNSVPEALAHPQAAHRQILVQQGDYTGVRSPMRLFGTPGTPGAAPPRFAQDTRSVLGDLGYTTDEQAQLHHAGGVPG